MPYPAHFIPYAFKKRSPADMVERSRAFFELMSQRRTVREFSPEPVPRQVLEQAILTAGSAPSGAHKQPWFFAVVQDPALKRQIRLGAEKEEAENYETRFPDSWLEDLKIFDTGPEKRYLEIAPVLVVVFRQTYQLVDGARQKNYYVQESVGIATGMLLAALHNAGLATLTHTPSPMAFLNQILNRPKNETPTMVILAGYPQPETRIPDLKRKALHEIAAFL